MLQSGELSFDECPVIYLHNLYLVTSYLYYEMNISMISDSLYDKLCGYIHDHLEEFMVMCWHKQTLDAELLRAGTGSSLDYPQAIIEIAGRLQG